MNYELCKQLKDTGFPQTHKDGKRYTEDEILVVLPLHDSVTGDTQGYYVPTLSELIAACGEDFVLERVANQGLHPWSAGKYIDRNGDIDPLFTADTPEEAVARLWLALHNQPNP